MLHHAHPPAAAPAAPDAMEPALCRPCRTTTECPQCFGDGHRPACYFSYELPADWYRSTTPGFYRCGLCRGTSKAPLSIDHFSRLLR